MKTAPIITILSTLLFFSQGLFAQLNSPAGRPDFNYADGYIIMLNGDTQYGEIKFLKGKYQNVGDNSGWGRSIQLKAFRAGKTRLDAEDIRGFVYNKEGYSGDVIYHSLPHPKKKNRVVFYELLLDGKIKVYANPRNYPMGEKIKPNQLSYYVLLEGQEVPQLIKKSNYDDLVEQLSTESPEFSG